MITVIDYGAGNLKSLGNALRYLGIHYELTVEPAAIAKANKLILPGVGAFGYAMRCMHERGIAEATIEKVRKGTPLLGICLGMQLLFTDSDEFGADRGLNLIPGVVRRFDGVDKVPHMGWNEVDISRESRLLKNLPDSHYAYFVHSYFCRPDEPGTAVGATVYGDTFCSVVEKDHIFGAQFHPEKSQEFGLALLRNFGEI